MLDIEKDPIRLFLYMMIAVVMGMILGMNYAEVRLGEIQTATHSPVEEQHEADYCITDGSWRIDRAVE